MNFSPFSSRLFSIILTAIAPILWGTTYIVTTQFLPENRPLASAVIRSLPAGFLLILLGRRMMPTISWRRLVILGITNIGIFQTMLFVAAYRLPGGIAAVVGSLQPLIILLLAWTLDQKRPNGTMIIATLAGVGGMTLLFSAPGKIWDIGGLVAALIGTISMATGTYLSRRWKNDMPLVGFTGWQLVLGGLFILPIAIVMEPPLPPLTITNWLAYGYLTVLGTALAYSLWFRGISKTSPVAVSALGFLSPVTALVLGWIFLGEGFGQRESTGIFIILTSVALLQISRPQRRQRTRSIASLNRKNPGIGQFPSHIISYQTNKHI